MEEEIIEFAKLSNGDRWYIEIKHPSPSIHVLHQGNEESGCGKERMELFEFLSLNKGSPEQVALRDFIGKLFTERRDLRTLSRSEFLMNCRDATEAEVASALAGAKASLPLASSYEALEFFNCMIDLLSGQRTLDDEADSKRIPAGFGSTG